MRALTVGLIIFICAGLNFVYAGDIDKAARSKALAHYVMAVAYDFNGKSDQAISEYERSAALNSKEPLPHLRLAGYYLRLGLIPKSIKQLKEALRLDPNNYQAHYLLGLIYSAEKKYNLAALEYEQILKDASHHNPKNLEIYSYLAQLYFSQGKYVQAISQFEYILKIQPDNAPANYYLGSAYLETNDRLKAIDFFKKTLMIAPDYDAALNSLAYMYAEEGAHLGDALRMARKAIGLDSTNGAYYDTLGWILFKKGMNAEALLALQKAGVYVQDAAIYDHTGDVYKAVNELALAMKNWRKSLDLDPRQPLVKAKIAALKKMQAHR